VKKEDRFFVVWERESGYTKYEHENFSNASDEAERLARAHPGKTFVVLHAISKCRKLDVETVMLDDGIPF